MIRVHSIISCSIGNILEWYDFGLFAIFSPLLSQLFFPTQDPYAAMMATLTVFSIGFFCRPLGALLFGYLGDRRGRASTLRLSVLMISIPTLMVGCLPSYQTLGILAPILLMLIRIWQGISMGGEYSGNMIYLGEIASERHRSFFTSLAASGANVGILLAMIVGVLVNFIFNDDTLKQWGWRIAYSLSGILCLIIYATRLNLQETAVFDAIKKNHAIVRNPITYVFKHHRYDMVRTLMLACMGSTFYYFSFIYLPIVLNQQLAIPLSQVTRLETVCMLVMVFLVPLAGLFSDKIGRYRMCIVNAIVIVCIIIPGYYLLHHTSFIVMLVVLSLFTLASSLEQGTTPSIVVENFPTPARYTGISLSYNIVNGFLGGSIPLVCAWLVNTTSWKMAPAIYVTVCAMITLTSAILLYCRRFEKSVGKTLCT